MKKVCKTLLSLWFVVTCFNHSFAQTPTLWGTSIQGGIGSGNIFSHNIGTNVTNNRTNFKNSETPTARLILSKDQTCMYGMTYSGGNGFGTIFKYDLNTRLVNTLYAFKGAASGDGANPFGSVIEGSDGALYGMTYTGGKNGFGIVFRWFKGSYTILHDFKGGADGASPYGSLIEINGILYGMTYAGGDPAGGTVGVGTIFALAIDGSSYKTFQFPTDGSKGQNPYGSLVAGADNTVLYGMTYSGSSKVGPSGVLFTFSTKSLTITSLLHGFAGGTTDGANPYGDVLFLSSSNTLLGLTSRGGASNYGTIFSYDLTKGSYTLRYSFNNNVGGYSPYGTLMCPTADNTFYYGTTTFGGSESAGTLFKWNPSKGYVTLTNFNGTNAKYTYFTNLLEYVEPLCKGMSVPSTPTSMKTCYGTALTLEAKTTATGASLLWYGTDTTNIATLTPNIVRDTTSPGLYYYYVSQIMNGCESKKVAIPVYVYGLPALPNVTTPVYYCQGATTSPLVATSNIKGGGTLNWYGINANGGTASNTATIPSSSTSGTTNYYVSQTNTSTGCEGPRASIAVNIYALPTAPGVSSVGYCLNGAATVLTAVPSTYTIPTTGGQYPYTLNWYGTNATGGTASTAAPTPSTSTAGTTTYYVSQTHPITGCEGPRAALVVTVFPLPAAPTVTSPVSACLGGTAPTLTATGTSLKWYTSLTGTGTTTPPVPSTKTVGTTTYYVSQTDVNGCEGPKASISFVVNAIPAAPVFSPPSASICQFSKSPDLNTFIKNYSGTLYWYNIATGGKPLTGTPKIDSSIVTTTTYYLSNAVNGCESSRSSVSVTVNITPPNPVAPTIKPVCAGSSDTLRSTDKPVGLFWWYASPTGGTPNYNPYYTSFSASTTYYIMDSTSLGCKSARVAVPIPITTPATPSVSITASSTNVCAGTSVTFTAVPVNGGTSPYYAWYLNGTQITSTITGTFTTTLSSNATVYVVMTSNANCIAPKTATSTTTSVTVNSLLTPAVSLTSTATTICAGTSVTFTATPTNGGSSPIYQWRINGINVGVASSTNTFTSTTLANNDVISVLMTSNATCVTSSTATSASNITMKVNPVVTPSVTLSSTQTTICAGNTATVTATATNGGTAPLYQWRVNGINVGTNSGVNTFTSTTLANGDAVSVILTSNATCATPTTTISSSNITFTVNPKLSPSVIVSTPATTVCPGSSVTFTATPTNGGTTPSYQWYLNSIPVTATTGSVYTTIVSGGASVYAILTSNATCLSSTTATSNTTTVTTGSNLVPTISISTPATTVCAGNATTFTASVANGGSAPSFQWKVNGTNVGTGGNSFTSTTLLTNDKVSAVLTSNETCVTTATATSNVITMTVNNSPNISSSVTATSPVCDGTASIVTINAASGVTYMLKDQNGNNLGSGIATGNGDFNINTINLLAPSMPVKDTINITASIPGCNIVNLNTKPVVVVNPAQAAGATVTATSPICSGSPSIISIAATPGITYTVRDQNNTVIGSALANASGILNITTGTLNASIGPTIYTLTVTASIAGCNNVVLTTKPTVQVNPLQTATATVTASSPICSGNTSIITVAAINGITYTVKDQVNNILGTATATSTGNLNINTSILTASGAVIKDTLNITASIVGCNNVPLTTKPIVTINPVQNAATSVVATSPICSGSSSVVTIAATSGITYTVRDQSNAILGTATATANGNINITTSALSALTAPTVYTLKITASAAGCSDVILTNTPNVMVNPLQNPSASVTAISPVCLNSSSTVTIAATNGISYTVRDQSNTILGTKTATATGNLAITTSALTSTSPYTLSIMASIPGCANVALTTTPVVTTNASIVPSVAITTPTTTICAGALATFTANPTNGGTTPGYQWRINGANVVGATGSTFSSSTLTNNDAISVVMTSVAACASPATATSTNVTVVVNNTITPSVNITSSASGAICSGTSVTFTATTTNGGTAPGIQWFINNTPSGTNSAVFTTTALKNSDTVSAVLTSNANCLGTGTAKSNKIVTAVNPNSTPTLIITTPYPTICAGTNVTFTATYTNGGNNPSIQWKVNGTNTGIASSSNTFSSSSFVNGDVVSAVLTSNASCLTSTTVNSSYTITMTVNPNLTPTVGITTASTSICKGTDAAFTATAINAGSSPTYLWKINGSNKGTYTSSNTFSSNALANNDIVSVLVKSNATCIAIDSALSNGIPISINTAPNISTPPTALTACEGSTATFSVVANGAGLSYQWKENGKDIAGANSSSFKINAVASSQDNNLYSVSISGTCAPSVVSNAALLTVKTLPKILTHPLDNTTCTGGSVNLSIAATGTGISYQWQENGVNINDGGLYSGTQNDTLTLTGVNSAQNNKKYTAIISNGCTPNALSNPATLTVGTNVISSISITASDTVVCKGTMVTFKANSSNGGSNPSFQWLRNNTAIADATSSTFTSDSLSNADLISCQMTSSNSCVTTKTVSSKAIFMDINSTLPTITSIINGNICNTGKANISAIPSAGIIKWFNTSTGGLALDTGQTFTTPVISSNALYYAEAENKGCISQSRTPVKANVSTQAVVSAGADQTVCESSKTISLVGTSNTGAVLWTGTGAGSINKTDSLSASYNILATDVTAGKITFIATSDKNGSCLPVSDTIIVKIASAGSGVGYIVPLDSAIIANMIINNFPSTQTVYKSNDPSTWKGIKTACGHVTEIRLPNKNLNGTLSELENLSQLEALDLSSNSLDSIETDLSTISNTIKTLNLSKNTIQYKRSIVFDSYSDLDSVNFSYNAFADSLYFIHDAPFYLDLSHNAILHFGVSKNGAKDLKTKFLNLSANQLNTSKISNIDSLIHLKHLDISFNQFKDSLPNLGTLVELQYLNASNNNLSNSIPNLAVMTNLDSLYLAHNSLNAGFANLKSNAGLVAVDLGNNKFKGDPSVDLSALSQLQYFAIDSNNVDGTEKNSGVTSLPVLPLNKGLKLLVQDNHLDFIDLEPYATLFNKVSASYAPQYDSIDKHYTIRPAEGSFLSMTTTLTGNNTQYQWQKYSTASQTYENLNIQSATEQTFKKLFANSDTGKYSVVVSNTDFPGLKFYRRPVSVEACDFSYNTNFFVKKPALDKCFGIDTLFVQFTTKDNKPVTDFSNIWYFNDRNVISEYRKSIPIHVSGIYSFLAFDSTTGCSIFSKDTIMVKTTSKINPALEIKFNSQDSSVFITNISTDFQGSALQWLINGLPIANATGKSLRIYYNGTYQLLSIKTDSCSAISEPLRITAFGKTFERKDHAFNTQGQVILSQDQELNVFPSPAQNEFNIEGTQSGSMIHITNPQGVLVSSITATSKTATIDASDFPSGLYTIQVTTDDVPRFLKIMIVK